MIGCSNEIERCQDTQAWSLDVRNYFLGSLADVHFPSIKFCKARANKAKLLSKSESSLLLACSLSYMNPDIIANHVV